MKLLPMTVEVLHEATLDCLLVEGTMLRDFGPWKRNQKVTLTFNFEDGTVTQHDDEGEVVLRMDLVLSCS